MCIFKKELLPEPKTTFDITSEEIKTVLKSVCPNAMILIGDSFYKTTTKSELMRFLDDDDTNEYRYITEYYDCEDFSFRLMGQIHCVEWGALSFGIVWTKTQSGNHAVNCFIDNERKLWFIEPQTDFIGAKPNDWEPYVIII